MKIDIQSIQNPQVRAFYSLYWPQHQIVCDFFACLPETAYDFRMVDSPGHRSDSPRESLAHILYVNLVYFYGIKSGKLEFKSMGTENYKGESKSQLLEEMERIDQELFDYLTSGDFDSNRKVAVFWGGEMDPVDVLFFLRDHDILHIGWNLAYMDHLNMPRFESLKQYWG